MKSIFRRLTGKSTRFQSTNAADANLSGVELENLEPRLLFSAAPVEAPSETDGGDEPQAAEESVAAETPTQQGQVAESTGPGQNDLVSPEATGDTEVAAGLNVNLVDLGEASSSLNQETLEAIFQTAPSTANATLSLDESGNLQILEEGQIVFSESLASVNQLTIIGNDLDNTLLVDFVNGNPIPAGGLTYDGVNRGTDFDVLDFANVPVMETLIGEAIDQHDGSLELVFGNGIRSTIDYLNIEPIAGSSITATNVTLNYSATAETITISNPGGGDTTVTSTSGESVTFANPSGTLTIDGGDTGVNIVNVNSLAASYSANLIITGGNGGDTVNLNGAVTFAAGKSLTVGAHIINAPNATSDIATSGSGSIDLTVTRNVLLGSGSSLATVDGGIALRANAAGTTSGTFDGVVVTGGSISTTGSGSINLVGQGGTAGKSQGIVLKSASSVTSTPVVGGGSIILDGTGDGANATGNTGVLITNAGTLIDSKSGAIQITGTGGDGRPPSGFGGTNGVTINVNAVVSSSDASGAATITINGTGGVHNNSSGVSVRGSVTSINGDIDLNGLVIGVNGAGVSIGGTGTVESSGAANITLAGDEGSTSGSDIVFGATAARLGNSLGTGTITLIGTDVRMFGTPVIDGQGALVIQPKSNGDSIGLGNGASGDLNLNSTELSRISDGFSSITIGSATAGDIDINTATFRDPLNLVTAGRVHDGAGTDINMTGGDTVTVNGTVAPGQSPGILNVTGNFDFADNSTVEVEIGGTSPGTANANHDQISATGSVTIGNNVTLSPLAFMGFTPSDGDSFTLIERTGGSGNFAGLAEGGTIANFLGSGLDGIITYQGGNGDDIVITAQLPPNVAGVDGSGNLTITADGDGDTVTLSVVGSDLKISTPDDSITGGGGTTTDAFGDVLVPIASLTSITLNTGDDADTINITGLTGFTGSLDIMGGDGQDKVTFKADVELDDDNDANISAEEIDFVGASIETKGTGSIDIDGTGGGTGAFQGINLNGTDLTASGTGSVSLTGQGGDTGSSSQGIQFNNSSTVSTADGDITLVGTGSGTAASGNGISVLFGSSIDAGGSGNLMITGSASGNGTSSNDGVYFASGSSASVVNGTMTIVGTGAGTLISSRGVNLNGTLEGTGTGNISITGSSTGTGSNNYGIMNSGSIIRTTAGSGSISLTGTGSSNGTSTNVGVHITKGIGGSIATGGDGGITINGQGGGSATGTNNRGVGIEGGIVVAAAGDGAIIIDGSAGSGSIFNDGVRIIAASQVTSVNGAITIKGTGGGTLLQNRGINLAGTVKSTGSGNVTLEGTGSQSSSSTLNQGVYVSGGTVSANTGALTITGVGGTGSSSNAGVSILNSTVDGGAGSLITGTGGGTTTGNYGVYMQGISTTNLTAGNVMGTKSGTTADDLFGNFF